MKEHPVISTKRLAAQMERLQELKRMGDHDLRREYKRVFKGTKYWRHVPGWMHRSELERRLWYAFALKHYHYPPDHDIAIAFRRQAKKYLLRHYDDPSEEFRRAMGDYLRFSKPAIKEMAIEEVDRYLLVLGLYVHHVSPGKRRKVLWEWFNRPLRDLSKTKLYQRLRTHRSGRLSNQAVLRDLILAAPDMTFWEFKERYGQMMPTVTRRSYIDARYQLRKAGYELPRLSFVNPHKYVATRGGKKTSW